MRNTAFPGNGAQATVPPPFFQNKVSHAFLRSAKIKGKKWYFQPVAAIGFPAPPFSKSLVFPMFVWYNK